MINRQAWEWIIAGDVCSFLTVVPHPGSSLAEALEAMDKEHLSDMPVVESASGRVVGLVSRERINRFIQEKWLEISKDVSALQPA